MEKNDALEIIKRLAMAFPGCTPKDVKTYDVWCEVLADVDRQAGERAARLMTAELEQVFPGSNLGAMIRNRALPKITAATIEQHLHRARADGNPYAYLKGIDAKLLEMAERADLFSRDLTAEAAGFRVRDVAKQYLESRENEKRGYKAPEPLPADRQLPAPSYQMTDEQREANKQRARELAERFGRKA